MSIVINRLCGRLATGEELVVGIQERIISVSTIVELEGHGEDSSKEPRAVTCGFFCAKNRVRFELGFHEVGALTDN